MTAQAKMKQMAETGRTVDVWLKLEQRLKDVKELALLEAGEDDAQLVGEIEQEVSGLEATLEELEFELSFSGEYDKRNAIMAIHAGAGGVESQDWAEMLLRMYLRWAERRGFKAEVLDTSLGEEAGIKSAIVEIKGEHAVGYLKSEHGVHRLIRLSPFDADHARHTSFALVEVMPEAETETDLDIKQDDLKVETFRSSGPGGQHMQKTSSAVRITHLPTGLIAASQSERSQHQNKEIAMRILTSRLLKLELARQEEERASIKGEHVTAGWGNQIRSYILHPYKMVKDHRTNYETGGAENVLDGDLDGFINAYLRFIMGKDNV